MKEGLNIPNGDNSRRNFLKKISALGIGAVLAPSEVFSQPNKESKEQNRVLEKSFMKEMEGHGNLPEGFYRSKINIRFQGENEIEGAGSFFSIENEKAKVDFLSNTAHPEFFSNGVVLHQLRNIINLKEKKLHW